MKKLLILDNYDSFTYNLAQLVEQHGRWDFHIQKNDDLKLSSVTDYDKILLSPGAGLPSRAGLMPQLINAYARSKPILGICLGHQAIAEFFGASLYQLSQAVHGIKRKIHILNDDVLFKNIPKTIDVGLYHSWAVKKEDLPKELLISAVSDDGVVMALKHKFYDIRSLQFHPESIMTTYGREMIWNWLEI